MSAEPAIMKSKLKYQTNAKTRIKHSRAPSLLSEPVFAAVSGRTLLAVAAGTLPVASDAMHGFGGRSGFYDVNQAPYKPNIIM